MHSDDVKSHINGIETIVDFELYFLSKRREFVSLIETVMKKFGFFN